MKISIITWDASFRERFHTVDSFCTQNYSIDDFEFIWVDFYTNSNQELLNKIEKYPNAQLLNLNNPKETQWHLGKCINAGIKAAKGSILVFPDGDIIVQKNHLKTIVNDLDNNDDLVLYFRRWDELQNTHGRDSFKEEYLEKNTKLFNATNYAGCFALNKTSIEKVNYYEEDDVFAGPGSNGMETYLRLRNAGFAIKWHKKKIYHPWHPSTGFSDKKTEELIEVSKTEKWLKPYSGIKQSWVLKNRELDLSYYANDGTVSRYLDNVPTLEDLKAKYSINNKSSKSFIKKIFG